MLLLVLPDAEDDEFLLHKARAGDKNAIGQIYRRYVEPLYHFARLRLADSQAAEDMTSLVFEKFLNALKEGKAPTRHLRGWLFQVMRNAIHDTYGRQQNLPIETIEEWENPEAINPENSLMQAWNRQNLREAIRQLSPDQQDILLLRFDQQLSIQETAEILGKNPNTIKALQFRAVNRLRELLQRKGMKEA